jgi:hypothetical protein
LLLHGTTEFGLPHRLQDREREEILDADYTDEHGSMRSGIEQK